MTKEKLSKNNQFYSHTVIFLNISKHWKYLYNSKGWLLLFFLMLNRIWLLVSKCLSIYIYLDTEIYLFVQLNIICTVEYYIHISISVHWNSKNFKNYSWIFLEASLVLWLFSLIIQLLFPTYYSNILYFINLFIFSHYFCHVHRSNTSKHWILLIQILMFAFNQDKKNRKSIYA